jgi:hypothetical protein
LLQHVEHTLSTVHFGMSRSTRFMETAAQLWAIGGPAVLLVGTVGEVFYFIWQYTTNPAWWVIMSILVTVAVLETTFMVVSWKSATIRNRAEGRASGLSTIDKIKLRRYHTTWFVLAVGVGVGQTVFLVVETLRGMQEQAAMFNRLGSSLMRALFDPELPDEQREKILLTMQSFLTAGQQPPSPRTRIEEEDT